MGGRGGGVAGEKVDQAVMRVMVEVFIITPQFDLNMPLQRYQ